ncbi:cupin domain-containing protein [Aureibacter tunicatorum]|uniref:cupin domain-containing protein n=1 Tax=Aureibacter tunicatorum TaxID=866807 RepID=UPI00286A23EC|nr:cupin domain-containing protein [Aureibacter tunicatorum]
MNQRPKNIFDKLIADRSQEVFDILEESNSIKIERIVSFGQKSPSDFWYDQEESEWVIVLEGYAELEFEGGEIHKLGKGDYINIPARQKHRVIHTSPEEKTIWLAVFYKSEYEQ